MAVSANKKQLFLSFFPKTKQTHEATPLSTLDSNM
jgi:hypothetical protein